jgi:hypothetical protein
MDKIYVQIDKERVEATGDVLAELLAAQAAIKAESDAAQATTDKAKADKAAAQAKLAALGLTPDDLKALGL